MEKSHHGLNCGHFLNENFTQITLLFFQPLDANVQSEISLILSNDQCILAKRMCIIHPVFLLLLLYFSLCDAQRHDGRVFYALSFRKHSSGMLQSGR